MAAMALPASKALPPPKPMTRSHRSRLARATPRRTTSRSGSPSTAKGTAPTSSSRKASNNRFARAASRPLPPAHGVRILWPAGLPGRLRPRQKSSGGGGNSKPTGFPPVHHFSSGGWRLVNFTLTRGPAIMGATAPRHFIMPGLLMFCLRLRVAIGFDDDKEGGSIRLLHQIEAGDARFLQTFPRIGDGGLLKRRHAFGLDGYVNMDNEHKTFSAAWVCP